MFAPPCHYEQREREKNEGGSGADEHPWQAVGTRLGKVDDLDRLGSGQAPYGDVR